jgi:hypothetical protein
MLRWLIVALALFEAGYLAFDGARALILGDYMTPATGAYAGRLGPWADLIAMTGLDPRSLEVRAFIAAYGSLWLGFTAAFAFNTKGVRWVMLVLAIGSLWYFPLGTIVSVIQILLLLLFHVVRPGARYI